MTRLVKENIDLKDKIMTRDGKIAILEKQVHPFNCNNCSYEFTDNTKLEAHIKFDHPRCLQCDTSGEVETFDMQNVHTDAVLVCTPCKLTFPNTKTYDVHNKKRHSKKHKCKACKETFSNSCFLMEHMISIHTITIEDEPAPSVACFVCGQKGASQD